MIGYATNAGTTTGLEQSLDDYLTGANTNLTNTFKDELNRLGGQTVHGDNVYLTLRPDIQRLALDQLAGRCGAVVVLDAQTGAVVAMASSPTYNANLIIQPHGYDEDREDQGHLRRRFGAPEQRDRRSLSAGLDIQDGDRRGRARLGRLHAQLAVQRPRLLHRVRQARLERGQPRPERPGGVRQRLARRRASSTRSTRSSATSACTSAG